MGREITSDFAFHFQLSTKLCTNIIISKLSAIAHHEKTGSAGV